jgi:hypothetical protein
LTDETVTPGAASEEPVLRVSQVAMEAPLSADARAELVVLLETMKESLENAVEKLEKRSESARAFSRLPVRVQAALEQGEVVDSDIVKAPNAEDISFVTMVVRGNAEKAMTQKERNAVIDALHMWNQVVFVAGHSYDIMKEHGNWLPAEKMESAVKEALSTIGRGQPPGNYPEGDI